MASCDGSETLIYPPEILESILCQCEELKHLLNEKSDRYVANDVILLDMQAALANLKLHLNELTEDLKVSIEVEESKGCATQGQQVPLPTQLDLIPENMKSVYVDVTKDSDEVENTMEIISIDVVVRDTPGVCINVSVDWLSYSAVHMNMNCDLTSILCHKKSVTLGKPPWKPPDLNLICVSRNETFVSYYLKFEWSNEFSNTMNSRGYLDFLAYAQAVELKDEMLEKGNSGDSKVFGCLMDGHANNENADGVFAVYEEHHPAKKSTVNIRSLNIMVEGCCVLEKFTEVVKGFKRMGAKGCNLDTLSTFDVSLLTREQDIFEVRASAGGTHLGGVNFDHRLMGYFTKLIMPKHNKDISRDNRARGKLRREWGRAKRALGSQHQVRVEIETLFDVPLMVFAILSSSSNTKILTSATHSTVRNSGELECLRKVYAGSWGVVIIYAGNTPILMYLKNGETEFARNFFTLMPAQIGDGKNDIKFYHLMCLEGYNEPHNFIDGAHWFYDVNAVENDSSMKSFTFKEFSSHMFNGCDFLEPYVPNINDIFKDFNTYMFCVPVSGAFILHFRFAVGHINTTDFGIIYELAQCTPELSSLSCGACLDFIFTHINRFVAGNQRGISYEPSCGLRYSLECFYEITANASPLQAPLPMAPPQLVKGNKISMTVIIEMLAVAPRFVILVSVCMNLRWAFHTHKKIHYNVEDDDDDVSPLTEFCELQRRYNEWALRRRKRQSLLQLVSRDDEAVKGSSIVENDHALLEGESRGVDGNSKTCDIYVKSCEKVMTNLNNLLSAGEFLSAGYVCVVTLEVPAYSITANMAFIRSLIIFGEKAPLERLEEFIDQAYLDALFNVYDTEHIERLISCLSMAVPIFMRGAPIRKLCSYLRKHIIHVFNKLSREVKLYLLKNLPGDSHCRTYDSPEMLSSIVHLLKNYMSLKKIRHESNLTHVEGHVLLMRSVNIFLIFSWTKSPEVTDLEDKVNFKGGEMLHVRKYRDLGDLFVFFDLLT